MTREPATIRVASVQAAPAFLDLDATLDLVDRWTAHAAGLGARIVAFPETFVPGYPAWVDHAPAAALWDHAGAREVFARLVENSVAVPGPAADRLGAAARANGVALVIGVHERAGRSLYNALLSFGPDGALLGHHRKLVPTHGERLLWAPGDAAGLAPVATQGVRLGGLVCWEHWMPAARQALHDAGEQIHVAAWPAVKEMNLVASRHYAFEGRCFVIAAGGLLRAGDLPADLPLSPARPAGDWLLQGGSAIIGPDGRLLAGPAPAEETVLVADCDLRDIVRESMTLDVSGHYARPDVFQWKVNRERRGVVEG